MILAWVCIVLLVAAAVFLASFAGASFDYVWRVEDTSIDPHDILARVAVNAIAAAVLLLLFSVTHNLL